MDSPLRLKFWGTRGLISSPRAETAIFGGNTSCIQILYKGHLLIVDTGFGVTNLGEDLMKIIIQHGAKLNIHIFYTHFHWDHIQGLPFFHPIYFKTSTLNLYSPVPSAKTTENLDLLFDGSYSPFSGISSMPSTIHIVELKDTLTIDDMQISFTPIDHGQDASNPSQVLTYAYKFRVPSGETLVIATDHEARTSPINDQFIAFAKDCDLLVHDAQYDDDEYQTRMGWGHSTVQQALSNAIQIKPNKVLLTHHDPSRSDSEIQEIFRHMRSQELFKSLNFEFAREGTVYNVMKSSIASKKVG
jgi:phosphoribosyl 1,2-cyclic phosphodiesterase